MTDGDLSSLLAHELDKEFRRQDEMLSTPSGNPSSPLTSLLLSANSEDRGTSENESSNIERKELINLKLRDFDHQRRFERFLALCGVKRKIVKRSDLADTQGSVATGSPPNGNSSRYNLFPDSSDMSETDNELDDSLISDPHQDSPINDLLVSESSGRDQDLFYLENDLAFPQLEGESSDDEENSRTGSSSSARFGRFMNLRNNRERELWKGLDDQVRDDPDCNTVYVSENYYEHAMIGGQDFPSLDHQDHYIPLNSNDTFKNFENHKKKETINLVQDFQIPEEIEFAVKHQPAQKFEDPLTLKFHGHNKLHFGHGDKYKNNICCCSSTYNVLFVGSQSELSVFAQTTSKYKPDDDPLIKFDVRPQTTTEVQRENSTWPHFPHTINYITANTFLERETLCVACDDGRVLLYFVEPLMEEIYKLKKNSNHSNNQRLFTFKFKPDFELTCSSSVWGADMYRNLVITSSNSQSLKLFYIDEFTHEIYSVQSHQMLHNIPSVCFIKDEDEIYVSAVSISGELVVFKFPVAVRHGPNPRDPKDSTFVRITFKKPYIISRAVLGDNVWCTQYVESKFFKKVSSLELLLGDPWIDQHKIVLQKLLNESKILDCESDECYSSHIGLSSNFHNFFVPTISFSQPNSQIYSKPFTSLSDSYRRIKKIYDDYYLQKQRSGEKPHDSLNGKSYWEPVVRTPQFNDKFLVVSTALKVGLFRANKLICNATISNLFQYKPLNEDLLYSNRLSLSMLIPELNCYVVASQVGLVSIFRLTSFRGIHGMRQEFVLPNYSRLCLSGTFGVRTLIGLSCRRLKFNRYLLFLTYVDGLCLTYELSDDEFNFMNDLSLH